MSEPGSERWEWEQFYARTLPISFEIAGRAASDLPDGLRADGSGDPASDRSEEEKLLLVSVGDRFEIRVESDDLESEWERAKRTVDAYLEARYDD